MPIAGLVAGALCASVGWMVLTRGLGTERSVRRERQDSEQALVDDCLANVDRVIDFPTFDSVIDLREIRDIRNVEAHQAPAAMWSVDDATVA